MPISERKKLSCVGPKLRIGGGKFGRTPLYYYFARDLEEIRQKQTADPRNGKDDLLTLDEAAMQLKVSAKVFRNWTTGGFVPVVRIPGALANGRYSLRVFVKRETVNAILAARNGNGASKGSAILNAAHKPAQTASDAGNGSPSGTQGNGERAPEHVEATAQGKPTGRGRKVDTDVNEDRRIFEAWKTGCYQTKEDLARELNKASKHVKAAIDRHRHRQKCQTLGLEKLFQTTPVNAFPIIPRRVSLL